MTATNQEPSDEQETIPDTIIDTLVYLQTGIDHNDPLGGSTQQPM